MMKIRCTDLNDLMDVCAKLVERGLTFEASTDLLVVYLTGGY